MNNDPGIQLLKEKVDDINQQAWNVRVNDSPKAFVLSKDAVELARRINYKEGLAHGLKSLGFCYVRLSMNDEAQPLLEEALSLFESLCDEKGLAVVYQYLAIIQRSWGDFGGALELLFKALELSQKTAFRENEAIDHYQIGVTYKHLGNFEKALDSLFKSLSINREMNNRLFQSYSINVIGSVYFENGEYEQALEYYLQGLVARREASDKWGEAGSLDNIGFTYLKLQDYQQAINYCEQGLEISRSTNDKRGQANALLHLAEIHKQKNDSVQATRFSNDSLVIRKASGDKRGEAEILLFLADLYKGESGDNKDTFEYLNHSLKIAEEIKALDLLSKARFHLYEYYKQNGDFEEALKNLDLHNNLEKEFHKNTINQKILNLEITHKAEEAKKETEAIQLKNEELIKLNTEIEEQKKKLEEAIAYLKATQSQLIQSEKMASLGELTAGIAHEIQNPLNFVNNFSEVSNELIDEMKEELSKGNYDDVSAIADDVKQNLEKINHHGKRADAIVKGMLQHSRSSNGQKELTNINVLANEYLRLAYHGLRAKDKNFNADFTTDFDEAVGKVNIVPQDIGRVLLNLLNNGFYAVNEKRKTAGSNYKPQVSVSTKKLNDKIEISIFDNGNGIPQNIVDKVFQPFFTTKPTGQGTGLGLSLAYDIVKAHGGKLDVKTSEGEGTKFYISIPTD